MVPVNQRPVWQQVVIALAITLGVVALGFAVVILCHWAGVPWLLPLLPLLPALAIPLLKRKYPHVFRFDD